MEPVVYLAIFRVNILKFISYITVKWECVISIIPRANVLR